METARQRLPQLHRDEESSILRNFSKPANSPIFSRALLWQIHLVGSDGTILLGECR